MPLGTRLPCPVATKQKLRALRTAALEYRNALLHDPKDIEPAWRFYSELRERISTGDMIVIADLALNERR